MMDREMCDHIERALTVLRNEGLCFAYADPSATSVLRCDECEADYDTYLFLRKPQK